MRPRIGSLVFGALLALAGCATRGDAIDSAEACVAVAARGLRPVAEDRAERFLGKVEESTARCRGGERAVARRERALGGLAELLGDGRRRQPRAGVGCPVISAPTAAGIDGALIDLEYQRIELIKFNLFDNSGTYPRLRDGPGRRRRAGARRPGPRCGCPGAIRSYAAVGGAGEQLCGGELIRFRTLTGICNDIRNPLMGSAGMPFARNVRVRGDLPRARRATS